MTASQRRHLSTALMLGVAITVLVVALDVGGKLGGFENFLYRERALRCQRFMPAPTTQLVHLDVDDAALEEIGRWPWPRTVLAEVIDELRILGVKVVTLDVILPEAEQIEAKKDGEGKLVEIDHDGNLAAAIKAQGGVLVPVSLTFGKANVAGAVHEALVGEFERDLERPTSEVAGAVRARFGEVGIDELISARHDAIELRVRSVMERGVGSAEELERRLLPRTWGTPDGRLLGARLVEQYELERSRRAVGRLAREEVPGEKVRVIRAIDGLLPTPRLAEAARYTGFVDHLLFNDGVVRAVPLWVEYQHILYPQMGMEMACAMLDIPVGKIRIERDAVIIPKKGGDLRLPVSSYYSEKLGGTVRLMSVPWFGTDVWQTMYDYPRHERETGHVPIGIIMQAVRTRWQVAVNNEQADAAMGVLAEALGMDGVKKFLESPPAATEATSRFEQIRAVLAEADRAGYVEPLKTKPREQMDDDEKKLLDAYNALGVVLRGNRRILDDEEGLRRQFTGKAVLIGSVASGASDFVSTPLHAQCPGAVVHGAVFNAIMTGVTWTVVPTWVNVVVICGVGLLVTFAVGWLSPPMALVATLLVIAGYLGINGYVVFDYGKHILGAAGPVSAAIGVWGVVTVTRYMVERAEAERVRGRFRSYVDEQLVDYVLENPHRDIFEGEDRELTVAFTDMKGFTTLMERLGKRIVPILNEYMSRMVPIIQGRGGIVNKFLGDGIMFFYGSPLPNHDHAIDAVDAILEMQGAVRDFNQWLAGQGLEPVAVRAGVTTGFMVVGDAGSKKRSDYTVLGDSVNLASRLESANKYFGTSALISERTVELLEGRFLVRSVARVRVVGKVESVMAYEPLSRKSEATQEQVELAEVSEKIVGAYAGGRFGEVIELVNEGQARMGAHRFFELYLGLARGGMEGGVEGFEGVVELSEK